MQLSRISQDSTSLTYGLASASILVEPNMRIITVSALILAGFTPGAGIESACVSFRAGG